MISLVLGILLTVTLVALIHYFPFMTFARRGQPGTILYLLNTLALVIPVSGVFLDWGIRRPTWQNCDYIPVSTVWVFTLIGFAALDLVTFYGLCLLDNYINERMRADNAEAESQLLKDNLE